MLREPNHDIDASGAPTGLAEEIALIDASLTRLSAPERVLAVGRRRQLLARQWGADASSAKFAQDFLVDTMKRTGLKKRSVYYDLEYYDAIEHPVLKAMSMPAARKRKVDRLWVLTQLKGTPRSEQMGLFETLTPRENPKRQSHPLYEFFLSCPERVQDEDLALIIEHVRGRYAPQN